MAVPYDCHIPHRFPYGEFMGDFLSAFAESHGFLSRGLPLCGMRKKAVVLRYSMSADNPDEYGEIIEENFAISYESG